MSPDQWDEATPASTATRRNGKRGAQNGNGNGNGNGAVMRRARGQEALKGERLPPHADDAEQGVLACCLLAPMEAIPKARKRLKDEQGAEFYDLRNREVWLALCRMYDDRLAGKPICSTEGAAGIDTITLRQRLIDYQNLEAAGGTSYVGGLDAQKTPNAFHVEYYVDIVAEKYTVRRTIALCTETALRLYDWSGQAEHLLHTLEDDVGRIAREAAPPGAGQKMYVRPAEAGDEFYQRWFGRTRGVHGLALPAEAFGDFPFLVRTRELTLLEAETKMGKSTLASYVALHLMEQGMRVVIDSREVHYADTFKKITMQLTGVSEGMLCQAGKQQVKETGCCKCECAVCKAATRLFQRAVQWLDGRLIVNKTTGIRHWRELLDAFYELAREGYNFFLLDSLMRIGIADDDFTQQAMCVTSFAQFAIETDTAMWLVNHRNKGSGDYRQKSGGSYKVAANASNICSVVKHGEKYEKLASSFDLLKGPNPLPWDDFLKIDVVKQWLPQYDAKFYVHDQRLDNTRTNAARELWFLKRSGQYFDHRKDRPTKAKNWLDEWTGVKSDPTAVDRDDPAANFPREAVPAGAPEEDE